jgi:oxygen-independent coproporphyrinogen III oxidase
VRPGFRRSSRGARHAATASFDADLLRRYDRPGPRYTSYPTAPQFTELTGAGFGEATSCARAVAAGAALYLLPHAATRDPIPRRPGCRCTCTCRSAPAPASTAAATASSPATRRRAEGYLARLYREIDLVAPLFDRDREVIQLHFGGGTPNFLTPAQLREWSKP